MRSLVREFQLGGVTLFKRNIEAPEQVAELSHDLQQLSSELPLWVAVDQEGGRWHGCAPVYGVAADGDARTCGDETLAYRFAAALAAELTAVGITLDYAPVLDIHTNPKNPIIGDRALAEDAGAVAKLGAQIIRGLQQTAWRPAASTFPGHGDTSVDSHLALPLVEHPPDRIRRVECVPFAKRSATRSRSS
jgi:beta-N-acetylhexosaminidase